MPKKCPPEVIAAGAALVHIRLRAAALADEIDTALPTIRKGIAAVVDGHGAKNMQAGTAIRKLRELQGGEGLAGEAHDSLRKVLAEVDIAEPTDAEIKAFIGDLTARVASIR